MRVRTGSVVVGGVALSAVLGSAGAAGAQPGGFVNWETPHVSPMAMTPDGTRLLAVNTADAKLEVFSLTSSAPKRTGSVAVGLDPVSVRMRSNTEAWVVNHISDSVSIVDLTTMAVTATLKCKDEPWDVVFAGGIGNQRAFVSCGTDRAVLVFDPSNLGAAPTTVTLLGEQPRAMGVSADGSKVYVAIFESGNKTTVLGGGAAGSATLGFPPNVVNLASGPWGGANPPPNSGAAIVPTPTVTNPTAPKISLIVKKNAAGEWRDDNNGNWSDLVTGPNASQSGRLPGWDLYDHDVAVIDAATLGVTYIDGLMNICMSLGVNPSNGRVLVVGTEATNEIRFEPVVNGKFVRVMYASIDPGAPMSPMLTDLNPHLNYSSPTVAQTERDKSIGDPRGVVFDSSGLTGYVSGMGSNNVIVIGATGARGGAPDRIGVGKGPTGLVLDEGRARLYVLNKFDASISTIDTSTRAVVGTTAFFDPTPAAIRVGRKHLYDTHKNSGLGQASCASCHVDSKMDRLAWDLGDPQGSYISGAPANRNLGQGLFGLSPGNLQSGTPPFEAYHPMKGPMTTQTLQDIIGKEPLHWRGDRLGLEEFNGAFIGLQGDDNNLTPTEMQEFEDFLATITFPPNPYRALDNSLPTSLPLPGHYATGKTYFNGVVGAAAGTPLQNGNAAAGLAAYRNATFGSALDNGAFACVTCHTVPTGAGTDYKMTGPLQPPYQPIAPGPAGQRHLSLVSADGTTNVTMKIPQIRNEYKKVGFNTTQQKNTAGFGVLHDGSVDSIERFVSEPVFRVTGDQMVADLTALILAFSGSEFTPGSTTNPLDPPGPLSKDTHAAVGVQTTAAASSDNTLINSLIAIANNGKIGLIAKARVGTVGSVQRGYAYQGGGAWKSDRAADPFVATATLLAGASAATPITITAVPLGSQTRLGIERDGDTWLDFDEVSVCADPADPLTFPGSRGCIDVDGNLLVSIDDVFIYINRWLASDPRADFDGSGSATIDDLFKFLNAWLAGC